MHVAVLSALGLCASVLAQVPSLDQYVAVEGPIAKAGLLANIGSSGTKSSGAMSGVVIASPSTVNPDYLYTWIRDSSLVFKVIVDQYTQGVDNSLRGLIDDWVGSQTTIQQISNPSGTIVTGGLGEPKFNINETAFTGSWGRPQRDGPALRSTALITYANWLIANGNTSYVTESIWPIVQLDLDYVRDNWNQSTFDLWEEVSSSSFFTSAVQHRALRQGASLATQIGKTSVVTEYSTQADNVLCFMQSYWNPDQSYMTANTGGGRSGIDSNTNLASIHSFDLKAGCDAATFQPCSDKALSNLKVYVDSFRNIWPLNSGASGDEAVATGRYPEDVYQGGNPWYLTTAGVSEQLYDSLIVWHAQGSLAVTSISLPFFSQFSPSITTGTYASSTMTFKALTEAIQKQADGFLAINAKYTPPGGGLSEQFSKTNGTPLSAVDLTWSYASALTVFAARAGNSPASWGAGGLTIPKVCLSNAGPTVDVSFNVNATTVPGQFVYITGSVASLENWSPTSALPLSSENYPVWSINVTLPANTNIEYKYIRMLNGTIEWEVDPNDMITTPTNGSIVVDNTFRPVS